MGSSVALSASELALVTAGKPILCASNALEGAITEPRWNNGTVGSYAGEDNWTDPAYPTSFGYDGQAHLKTRPLSSQAPAIAGSDGVWRFVFRIDPDVEFDMAAIVGHNLGTIGTTFAVTLQIADNTDFTSNVAVAFWSPVTTDARLVELALDDTSAPSGARRYTGYTYGRLIIRRVGNTASFIPQIGEVILGRRRHLLTKPWEPYDDNSMDGAVTDVTSRTGAHVGYVKYKGRRTLSAHVEPDTTAEHTTIRTWFEEAGFGTKHFLWIENPASSPAATTYLMRLTNQARLSFPFAGPYHRAWDLEALEVPPFVSTE